ncbi:hypothetical protein Bca101_021936 [Brassica carinata]
MRWISSLKVVYGRRTRSHHGAGQALCSRVVKEVLNEPARPKKRRERLRGDETFPVRHLLRGCFSFGPIFKRKWRNEQLVLSIALFLSLSLLKKVPAVPILGKFCDEFSGSQTHSRVFSPVIQRRDLKTAVCSTETKLIKTIQMIDRKILCCPIKDKFMKDGNRFRKIERFLLADKKQQESIFAYRRLL